MIDKLRGLLLLIVVAVLILTSGGFLSVAAPQGEMIADKPNELQIQVIDVGHGDSILIISPSGKIALVDAGPYKGSRAVVQILRQKKITRIDYLVATHPHADHIGGMDDILEQFEVGVFIDNGLPVRSATHERLLEIIKDRGIKHVTARAGQTYSLGSNVTLRILSPPGGNKWISIQPTGSEGPDPNANSVVIRLEYRDFAMLLMGDARIETEEDLLRSNSNLRVQILKVGYHGSKNASSKQFLAASQAREAIISCGQENNYGHPRQETLDRIRQRKIKLFRTDLQGDILVITDGKGYRMKPERSMREEILFLGRKL